MPSLVIIAVWPGADPGGLPKEVFDGLEAPDRINADLLTFLKA
jgi:hypothetical protein